MTNIRNELEETKECVRCHRKIYGFYSAEKDGIVCAICLEIAEQEKNEI